MARPLIPIIIIITVVVERPVPMSILLVVFGYNTKQNKKKKESILFWKCNGYALKSTWEFSLPKHAAVVEWHEIRAKKIWRQTIHTRVRMWMMCGGEIIMSASSPDTFLYGLRSKESKIELGLTSTSHFRALHHSSRNQVGQGHDFLEERHSVELTIWPLSC